MARSPVRFRYLDELGIAGLLAQLEDGATTERLVSHGSKRTVGKTLSFGTAKLPIGAARAASDEFNYSVSTKSTHRAESQIFRVIDLLRERGELAEVVRVKKFFETTPLNFISGQGKFCIARPSFNEDVVADSEQKQHIDFEVDPSEYADRAYPTKRILMGGRLSRFVDAVGQPDGKYWLPATGHLACWLRFMKESPQLLGFFGQLVDHRDHLYVKPFGIWQP